MRYEGFGGLSANTCQALLAPVASAVAFDGKAASEDHP
jgi:hypothetical protein